MEQPLGQNFSSFQVPFHIHNGSDAPLSILSRFIVYRIVASTSAVSTGTAISGSFVMPISGTIGKVGATVDTAGTTGTMTINVLKNGTTIFTTNKITIASAATTSRTYTIQPSVTTNTFIVGDIFTFNVDTVQTTPAQGLSIFIQITTLSQ